MDKSDKLFLAVLAYVSKNSKAESCEDFIEEVFLAEKAYRKQKSKQSAGINFLK